MFQRTIHLYRSAYQGLSPSVWLLAGVMLINRCGTMVLPFLTLYLTQRLHFSVTNAGIVMAIYGLGAFVGTFLGGRLTDRFGFYYVQLLSLLFGGLALLVLQFITNFYALCGSVFIFTLFGDSFRPANQAAIAHYSDADTRTRAFSLNRLAINLGWTVGGVLGGWLASIDYKLLFWADGVTCLVAGIVLWTNLPVPSRKSSTYADPSALKSTSPEPSASHSPYHDYLFLSFVVCNALYLVAFMQFFSIVPLFFKEVMALGVGTIGLLMALNGILIVCIEMALVYSLEQQNRSKISLIMSGILLTTSAYLVLALPDWFGQAGLIVSGFGIALLFVVVITFGEMLIMPFLQSLMVERSKPATRGQYLALYSMGGALAQTTAPVFGSQMVAHFGFSVNWVIIALISLMAAGGFWWIGKHIRRRTNLTTAD
jgi:predicted MFS family arabinose efflux permease